MTQRVQFAREIEDVKSPGQVATVQRRNVATYISALLPPLGKCLAIEVTVKSHVPSWTMPELSDRNYGKVHDGAESTLSS